MKAITMYQTYDGEIHKSQQSAKRHLDNQYGKIIGKLSGDIAVLRLGQIHEYIDSHLEEFKKLMIIKRDMGMQLSDTDWPDLFNED